VAEAGYELGVPVADEEAERRDQLTEVHQQVASGLGGPGCGEMGGHTEQVHPAGRDLHEEQNIHRVDTG
jgi:hypothetical protein